jgi:putative protease
MPKPELLSPAGSFEAMIAAVQSGADAVYLGAGSFNARAYAKNFTADELKRAVDYCHVRGVSVHVTMNTLLLDKELDEAMQTARELYCIGVDALIVQDVGLISLLKKELPDFPLHASTQMAVHDENGVKAVQKLGMARAVLAREVSIEGIRRIRSSTDFPLEVFAGGAMCSSVSGLCLLSSFIGGRSGNRGACAQPCRMKYKLNGKEGYLLSMKDLCMLDRVGELAEAGVCSLKIEGRMKRPEYVAVVTEAYRRAIDGEKVHLPALRRNLLRAFNRGGFSEGYADGRDGLVAPQRPGNWGVPVGTIKKGRVELSSPLSAGDELAVRAPGADQDTTVAVKRDYPMGAVAIRELSSPRLEGLTVFRTVDVSLSKEALARVDAQSKRTMVSATLRAVAGEPLSLTLAAMGYSVTVAGDVVTAAKTAAAEEAKLRAQVAKLGDTPFELGEFTTFLGERPAFVPSSELNRLRREAAELLERRIVEAMRRTLPKSQPPAVSMAKRATEQGTLELIAQVAMPEQAEQAQKSGVKTLYIQPLLWEKQALLPFIHAAQKYGAKLFPVLPPLTMDDDLKKAIDLLTSFPAGTFWGAVASNIGQIAPLCEVFTDVRGDYTLNIANTPSATAHADMGLSKVTLSVELTVPQIRDIINSNISAELIVYGTIPTMHLLHCPTREQLGRCAKDCFGGARRSMTDRRNYVFGLHPVTLKRGSCDVMLLNSLPLDGLRVFDELKRAGASAWRLCFYQEDAKAVAERIAAYREALGGGAVRPLEPSTSGHFTRGVAKTIQKGTRHDRQGFKNT